MKTIPEILDLIVNTKPLENFVDMSDMFKTTVCLHMYNISGEMVLKGEY